MDLLSFWNQFAPDVRSTLVRVLLAALVLLLVWALRSALTRIILTPLRALARRANASWAELLLDTITPPARFLVIAIGLVLGAQILQVDPTTAFFVERVVRTLIIIAIFLAIYRVVDLLATTSNRLFRLTGMSIPDRLLPFARTATKLVLVALSLIIIVQEWGYDVSGLIAGLGLGGLALSLASKDTVENLFGFTTIVGDQPFVIGDFIKTPDVEGTVEHVGVRSTRIRQPNQAYVTVPNSKLGSSVILNWSRLSKRWYDLTLRIEYDASLRQINALLERVRAMLAARDLVEKESIIVHLVNFGDNGLEILIRCYIFLADWAAFTAEKEAINLEILKIVEELGLSIAIPNRSLYIEDKSRLLDSASSPSSNQESE